MLTDPEYYAKIKRQLVASENLDLDQKYTILESLYAEARALGRFTKDDLLLGLEDDIRLAAALNANLSSPPR